jgi:hypothetical protein
VAAAAALDHNTRTAAITLTQFMQIFPIDIFATAERTFLEEAIVARTKNYPQIAIKTLGRAQNGRSVNLFTRSLE